jgi:hypothetical protein
METDGHNSANALFQCGDHGIHDGVVMEVDFIHLRRVWSSHTITKS